jgi:hypothetical protein
MIDIAQRSCRCYGTSTNPWADFLKFLLRCMSLLLALSGHGAMSDLSPLCAPKRTSLTSSVIDPAPASSVPNDDPCASDRTPARRSD